MMRTSESTTESDERRSVGRRGGRAASRTGDRAPLRDQETTEVQRRVGNRTVQQLAGGDGRAVRPDADANPDGDLQRMCPRCRARASAGKPLDCPECEAELQRSETRADSGGSAAETGRASRKGGDPGLTVSDPDGRYEREADAAADAVMRMSAPGTRLAAGKPLTRPEREAELQRKAERSTAAGAGVAVADELAAARGRGRPLPGDVRAFFEPRFGRDFGDVRVHTGPDADRLARSLNARAFTAGSDVFFAGGEYRPGTATGQRLLAHELTHVVQQTRPPSGATDRSGEAAEPFRDPSESEARGAGAAVEAGEDAVVEQSAREGTVQRYGFGGLTSDVGGLVSSAASSAYAAGETAVRTGAEAASTTATAVVETGEAVVNRGKEFVEKTVEEVGEVGRALVERVAPGLIEFLRNPGERIRDALAAGLESFVSGALDVLGAEDVGGLFGRLKTAFTSAVETGATVVSELANGIGGTLGATLRQFLSAVETRAFPLLRNVQEMVATVQGGVESVLETLGGSVGAFIEGIGGEVARGIAEVASWAWGLTEPLRNYAQSAWNWVMERFGIAWESSEGVRNWLVDAAGAVWDSIVSTVTPVVTTLTTAKEALSKLAAFKPVVELVEAVGSLWESLGWMTENWNAGDVLVRARTTLRERVLPAVIDGVSTVTDLIGSVREWITGVVGGVASAFEGAVGAIRGIPILTAAAGAAEFVRRQVDRLATWASSAFDSLLGTVSSAMSSLGSRLEPVLDFLIQLGQVLTAPLRLPALLTGALWKRLPDQFKPPVITFLFDVLVRFVKRFPAFATVLGPLAVIMKQAVVGFLERLQDASTDVKITVSNRIADLLQGGVEFAKGYLRGMLRGIWEGLTDPFRIIYMLGQVAVGATRFLARHVGRLFADESRTERAQASLERAASTTEGADREVKAATDRASSQENATPQGVFEMLRSVWNGVLAKSAEIGGSIATALLDFIQLPDFELGDRLGWVGGTVLFEVVLYVLTAGSWAAVTASRPILRGILRFIDLGGELVGAVAKGFAKLKGPITSAMGSIGDLVRLVPGLGRVWDGIADALRSLFRVSEEASPAARGTGEAPSGARAQGGREATEPIEGPVGGRRDGEAPGSRAAAESAEFQQWRSSVTAETREFLRKNPEIEARYADMPRDTRELLTYCASVCVIENLDDISRRQIGEVSTMLRRLGGARALDDDVMVKLQMYFHTLSGDVDWAIRMLRDVETVEDLNRKLLQAFRRRIVTGGPKGAVDPDVAKSASGVVTGGERLPPVPEGPRWLAYTQQGAALPPRRIAERLRGREFNSFDDFRRAFWEEVGRDTELPIRLGPGNRGNLAVGKAPATISDQQRGARIKFELHHIVPVEQGGAVYDLSNIAIVSPRTHKLIHNILPDIEVTL